MFFKNNFLLHMTKIFIVFVLVILPTQTVFADDAEKHFEKGKEYFNSQKYDDAINEFIEAIDDDENNLLYYYYLGGAYFYSEQYDEALNAFNKMIQIDSDSVEAYEGRANVYYMQGRMEEAKTNFLMVGKKYLYNEEYDKAKDAFNRAIEIDKNYGEAYFYLGRIEWNLSNYAAAITEFDKAVNLGFVDYSVYNDRGYAKYLLKKYEEAIEDFDKAIKTNPTEASAYMWRGESYFSLGENKKARDDFTKYLELEEDLDEKTKNEYIEKIVLCENAIEDEGDTNIDTDDTDIDTDDTDIDSDKEDSSNEVVKYLNESGMFGEVNSLLKVLLIVMTLEYAIIIGCGIYEKNLTVGIAAGNFIMKIIFLIIIMVANSLDEAKMIDINIRNFIIAIILIHELLSILENAERLGIPVPDWLKNLLQNIKEKIKGLFR